MVFSWRVQQTAMVIRLRERTSPLTLLKIGTFHFVWSLTS